MVRLVATLAAAGALSSFCVALGATAQEDPTSAFGRPERQATSARGEAIWGSAARSATTTPMTGYRSGSSSSASRRRG